MTDRSKKLIGKPAKPHRDFPLFPHATRRWAKKVRGKTHYFGPWERPQDALALWLDQRDDLLAGRTPRANGETAGPTLAFIVNHFLETKLSAHNAGELSGVLLAKYTDTCKRVSAHFGADRLILDIRAEDFGKYRDILAAKWGPVTLATEIQRVRTMFKHAFDNDLITVPVKFGTMFKKPSRSNLRKHRSSKPSKLFPPEVIRAMLDAADVQMAAMIYLGINAGWGNQDVASVRKSNFDLDAGVATFPRSKTGVGRRVTLWPETVKAIKDALAVRPKAATPAEANLVFLTRRGNPWRVSESVMEAGDDGKMQVKWKNTDSVGLVFGRILRKLKINGQPVKQQGLNFYTLRHTFRTIAGGARDPSAVNLIMGHENTADTGETHYNHAITDARLKAVTDHVRAWLTPQSPESSQDTTPQPAAF